MKPLETATYGHTLFHDEIDILHNHPLDQISRRKIMCETIFSNQYYAKKTTNYYFQSLCTWNSSTQLTLCSEMLHQ